mmetsp:Transcript_20615/g.35188  ORF Transcript_20615/g.35188 Transcript_20615/m.35188 type:complete len:346 (-) Transcript_20615:94-1131(-)
MVAGAHGAVAAVPEAGRRVALGLTNAVANLLPVAGSVARGALRSGGVVDDDVVLGRLCAGDREVHDARLLRAVGRLGAAEAVHVARHAEDLDLALGGLSVRVGVPRGPLLLEGHVDVRVVSARVGHDDDLHSADGRRERHAIVLVPVLVHFVTVPAVEPDRGDVPHLDLVRALGRAAGAHVAVSPRPQVAAFGTRRREVVQLHGVDHAPRPRRLLGRVVVFGNGAAKVVPAETGVRVAVEAVRVLLRPRIGPVLAGEAFLGHRDIAAVVEADRVVVAAVVVMKAVAVVPVACTRVAILVALAVTAPLWLAYARALHGVRHRPVLVVHVVVFRHVVVVRIRRVVRH